MTRVQRISFGGAASGLSVQVDLTATPTLRIHHVGALLLREAATIDDVFARLHALCSPWNSSAHGLLKAYRTVIHDRMAYASSEIAQKLKPYEGLFRPADFAFSAPMPLPLAQLACSGRIVLADFAFCVEGRLTALLGAGVACTPRERAKLHHLLSMEGIRCIATDLFSDPGSIGFAELLGRESQFWRREVVPCGVRKPG